jgi:hypothetical protein
VLHGSWYRVLPGLPEYCNRKKQSRADIGQKIPYNPIGFDWLRLHLLTNTDSA